MAEALVSAIIEQLVSILRQQAEEGIRLVVGVDEEVQKLTSNFSAIGAVLEDAESRQVKDSAVRDWLDKLKDTSYDIDDVLDEWNTMIRKKLMKEAENASNPMRKVCSLIFSSCRQVVMRHDIAPKIKNLNKTLDVVTREKDQFNFRSVEGTRKLERPMTTSLIDISKVYGRDHEKNVVVNLLLNESSQGPLSVISIVGMGGIGKTTLARLAFNDEKVKAYFDVKIWVCVSDPFDEIEIAKAILESLESVRPNLDKLESLLKEIGKSIEKKKFLLVLDDVWTEDPHNWEQLKNALNYGAQESRILVTTRKENTAKLMGTTTTNMISLGKLHDEECWSLFSQIALSERKGECLELKVIGRKIVDKCKGLPLAVKTLASLLSLKTKPEQWQSVLDSELWKLEEIEKGIFPPLLFSYYDLPSKLRKCFSCCAIFPKDYMMTKDQLIKLWMGQGYLKPEGSKDMELIGEEYFENLAMRSFFQDFERSEFDGSITGCKMHDIVHDFAQYLTKNECFTIDADSGNKSRQLEVFYRKARHSRVTWEGADSFRNSVYNKTKSRSLVFIHKSNFRNDISVPKLFDNLTCLRMLELHCDHGLHDCRSITQLPRTIKKLIHLRHLKLSNNWNISALPEEVCDLCNLQILDVSNCGRLRKLPRGMGKLINLRHLINDRTALEYMPKGFGRLTSLRTLSIFVSGFSDHDSKACTLECLKNLKHLQGSLALTGLGYVKDVGDAKNAQLGSKEKIACLDLDFSGFRPPGNKYDAALEALQPSPHLEKLLIKRHPGKILFPSWLMSLTKLRMLTLSNCTECKQLPPLGRLPSLESLVLEHLHNLKKVGNEFLGIESDEGSLSSPVIAFPVLKYLKFGAMKEWEEWDYEILKAEDIKIMPYLDHLVFYYCPKLTSIPKHILQMREMNKLQISGFGF